MENPFKSFLGVPNSESAKKRVLEDGQPPQPSRVEKRALPSQSAEIRKKALEKITNSLGNFKSAFSDVMTKKGTYEFVANILPRRKLKIAGDKKTESENATEYDKIVSNPERRDFLKRMLKYSAIVASVTAVTVIEHEPLSNGLNDLIDYANDKFSNKDTVEEATSEPEEAIEEDAKPIFDLIKYDTPGRIDLTTRDIQAILTNYWTEVYKKDIDFPEVYHEMKAYDKDLIKIFNKEGVPADYRYLAIPESSWNMDAHSKAGAVGPFQFMAETARQYGLRVDGVVDERKDPIKSGRACAKFLKDLYKRTNDWDLALSLYNGGLAKGYLNDSFEKDESLTPYKDFLRYMEIKINKIRDDINKREYIGYEIATGDTIELIAKKHGKTKKEIMTLNKMFSHRIQAGKFLKIPYATNDKRRDFNSAIKRLGCFENFTYPAKFNAVLGLIKAGFPEARYAQIGSRHKRFAKHDNGRRFAKLDGNKTRRA